MRKENLEEELVIVEDKDEEDKDEEVNKKDRESDKRGGNDRCFDYVMPYSVMMPDSTTITVAEEKDREKIKNWYENNPKVEKRPMVQFPVDIYFDSEEKEERITISTLEEFKEILESCREFDKNQEKLFCD